MHQLLYRLQRVFLNNSWKKSTWTYLTSRNPWLLSAERNRSRFERKWILFVWKQMNRFQYLQTRRNGCIILFVMDYSMILLINRKSSSHTLFIFFKKKKKEKCANLSIKVKEGDWTLLCYKKRWAYGFLLDKGRFHNGSIVSNKVLHGI